MRKLSLILVAICVVALFASSAFAIDAGKWRVGGSADINYLKASVDSGGPDISLTNLAGDVGYFVAPNIEVGLGLVYAKVSESGSDLTATAFRPYGRYYFPTGDNAWFVGLGYDIASYDPGGGKLDISGFNVMGGYSIKVASNLSVDVAASYEPAKAKDGGSTNVKVMGLGAAFSIWL